MKQIKTGHRVTVEFLLFLAILLGAAVAPGLLSASSSTINTTPLIQTKHQEIP